MYSSIWICLTKVAKILVAELVAFVIAGSPRSCPLTIERVKQLLVEVVATMGVLANC